MGEVDPAAAAASAIRAPPSAGDPPPEGRALDRSLVRGIAWTGASRWATQLLSWASTLIVARLLTPADYGLVGMATIYIGLLVYVNELGLGAAIVQRRDLTEDQIARLGGLGLLAGSAFVAVSLLAATAVARFFSEPALRGIIAVSSLVFLTSALQIVPRALLTRDLAFRRLAWVDGAEALITTVTALLLAVFGLGYWALVLGPLGGRIGSTAFLNVSRPHRVAWPRQLRTIAEAITLGWQIVVARVAWYFYSNADMTIVGRVLGKDALGAYGIGWTIASLPVERVSALVISVTPAVFSAVQHDRVALQRYLRLLTEGLSFITFPAAVGIALVAEEFVLLALGEHWRAAVLPLRLLALSAALRSVSPLLPPLLVATGHARRNMQRTILATLILPALFYAGSHWGTAGVATAWVVGHPVFVFPLFLSAALHITGMRFVQYARALAPAMWMTAVMAAAVLVVRWGTPSTWATGIRFTTQVLAGGAVYAGLLFAAYRERIGALWSLLRGMRG
ncbi:MAG TPA: lipopolysaccharide biosynthesis protein [Gemmatimonadales bacterium]|jgi:PST family polysaccharide transporter|nr:lipopolysaccharide biosynthesis protein [Gemmatimonadales bacterium]